MKKLSNIATISVFALILFGFAIWGFVSQDKAVSTAERRNLSQMPVLTADSLMNGEYFKNIDKYTTDQFPMRDQLRTINALTRTKIMLQSDSNGIYVENGVIFKSDYPTNPQHINNFISKSNENYEKYIKGKANNYYVSVIPDKGYFDKSDHLNSDAKEIAEIFTSRLTDAEYIDIFDGLNLDCYYKTDTHWSQDKLIPVMDIFADKMSFTNKHFDYEENTLSPFYGVYHGQSALNIQPDSLVYFTNDAINSATVENIQKPTFTGVYDLDEFSGTDGYNLFLSGGTPLTTITSPKSATENELVIFRDSFGSSIAPLFLNEYRKVTLVDLRYLGSALLPEYVDFSGKDVLLLYSSLILNSNIILK